MPQQVEIKNALLRMNLDDSYYYLGKNDYVDALNITTDSKDPSQDIINTNVVGNRISDFTLPAGTNVCICGKNDELRGRVFEFIWNSNDLHLILIFDVATRVRTKLIANLTDTGGIDVLQFTLLNKINHCDILYRGEDEGDLMCWTDGNVSLRKINIKHIQDGIYSVIKVPFIELAKQPPRSPITANYGSDATRNSNSLRRKLIQATYRFCYDDFEKSSFTNYSKIPLPVGYYGSDNDIDSTKNNFITFTVETGDENVTSIEIAVRFNEGADWLDFVLIISLNKAQLGIPDNAIYSYLFYNDSIYPPITDGVDFVGEAQVIPLFDWVPKKADSQVLANGNVVVPAGITEGYGNYPKDQLDVSITSENVTNVPPDTDPPNITYVSNGNGDFTFTLSGNIPTGTYFKIVVNTTANPGPINGLGTLTEYTSTVGQTIFQVVNALFAAVPIPYQDTTGADFFAVGLPNGSTVISVEVISGGSGVGSISSQKTWLWDANYIFGQDYKDDQGRIMPGVTTFVNPTDSSNDYIVTTPSFSLAGASVQTPVITAMVNHLPMVGAVTFGWVRRRLTYGNFVMYETCDYQSDTDYLYFCLANIEKYKIANSQFIYGTAPITSESRIKIIAGITSSVYNGDIGNQDYEILGTVIKTPTGGTTPGDDVSFIKVKKPAGAISPAYSFNMLVMVYTPMVNPTSIDDSVNYEWAEEYAVYTGYNVTYSALSGLFISNEIVTGGTSGATGRIVSDNGSSQMTLDTIVGTFAIGESITGGTSLASATVASIATQNYHRGMAQDQTAIQPAIYVWVEGDVYFHDRVMYPSVLSVSTDTVPLMDSNWSDFFLSSVNDNGRGITIEVNQMETYFPATFRFSREYQQNTNINETNRFIYTNFIDGDRSFGSVLKMSIKDRYIRVGQQFKIGSIPLFNQISKDSSGGTLSANTDVLLNPIQYYLGDYGIGNAPGAWTNFNNSSYFFDTNRGIWCRLSQDGITPISILYKINSWATDHGVLRGNDYKIYGVFDPKSNYCIFAFEATNTDAAYTLSFDESGNAYKSFLSYHPEMMCAIGSLLITWKDGQLWTHDSSVYNNFYGFQYPSLITPVFNEQSAVKKKYLATGHKSLNNVPWVSPSNGDIATNTINPQTGLPQISQLKDVDYELEETTLTSAFWNDANSLANAQEAVLNGDYLGGNYLVMKLILPISQSDVLANISQPYITWVLSGRNF